VDRAKSIASLRYGCAYLVFIGDVAGGMDFILAMSHGRVAGHLFVQVKYDNFGAGLDKPLGGGTAESRCSTCDECNLVLEIYGFLPPKQAGNVQRCRGKNSLVSTLYFDAHAI
jgi:hypothetical protein